MLDGRRILVSGSEQALVSAVVRACAFRGARLCIATRSPALSHLIQGSHATVIHIRGWGEAAACDLADRARAVLGRLDGFVVVVGEPDRLHFSDIGEAEFDDAIGRSLKDVFLQLQACSPLLVTGASILLLVPSSGCTDAPLKAVAQAGTGALACYLAECWKPQGMRVNSLIEPLHGPTAPCQPREVAAAVVYLLADVSRPRTGAVIQDCDPVMWKAIQSSTR